MTSSQKTRLLFITYARLWGLYILFFLVMGILSIWLPELKDNDYEQTAITELLQNNHLKLFVLACIFAPVVEEMMFRTLIVPSHTDIILFISSWPVFIGLRFLPKDVHWVVLMAFGAIVLFTLYYILKQLIPPIRTQRIQTFLHKHTLVVLIGASLIFGLVHINNYVDTFTLNFALFMLIIPRILSGYMMGWIKIKNQGLIWAMGLHFLNNAFVVAIGILAS